MVNYRIGWGKINPKEKPMSAKRASVLNKIGRQLEPDRQIVCPGHVTSCYREGARHGFPWKPPEQPSLEEQLERTQMSRNRKRGKKRGE